MKKLRYYWDRVEIYIMTIAMILFLCNITLQIFTRLILKHPLSWTEEVSRFAFIWMVFMGLSYATRYDKHIRVDFLISKCPQRVQFVVEEIINALTIVVFCWVFWQGLLYIQYCGIVRTPALNIPRAWMVSVIPLSAFLMIVRTIEKIPRDIEKFRGMIAEKGAGS